jgi:hypothetical protein
MDSEDRPDLRAVLEPTAGAGLPLPRLQLVWVDRGRGDTNTFVSVCHYLLVFPVDAWDIRNIGTKELPFTAVEMGRTRSRSGAPGDLGTPYRDGVHAKLDAKVFGLPRFVSRGGRVRELGTAEA